MRILNTEKTLLAYATRSNTFSKVLTKLYDQIKNWTLDWKFHKTMQPYLWHTNIQAN